MTHVNDDKHCALLQLTGQASGTINDMVVTWLETETGLTGNINDLWHAYWDQQLIPAGQFNDRAYAWLRILGYSSSQMNGLWHEFWHTLCAGGVSEQPEIVGVFLLRNSLAGTLDGVEQYANFARAAGPSTVEDFEGFIHNCKDGEARFWGARRVENYYPGNSNTVDVLVIPLVVGQAYDISMEASVAFTLANVSGGLSHSYIFQDANDRIGFGASTELIATADTCNITIDSGGLQNIQVDKLTGSMDITNRTDYVEVGTGMAPPYYGANVDGVRYFDTARSTSPIPGAALTDMRHCLVEGSSTNLMQTDTELGVVNLALGTYSFQFSSVEPDNPAITILIIGSGGVIVPGTVIVSSGQEVTFEVTTAGNIGFAPSIAGSVQLDTEGKFVQMLQAGSHVGSFVTGTRPAETLSVPRPALLDAGVVENFQIALDSHTINADANLAPNSTAWFINGADADNNLRCANTDLGGYYFRWRVGGVNADATVDDDYFEKRRRHLSRMQVSNGLRYDVNGVEALNGSVSLGHGAVGGFGDGLIHLGTTDSGSFHMNAGVGRLFITDTKGVGTL